MENNKSKYSSIGRVLGLSGMLILLFHLSQEPVLSQVTPGEIPDGTQGETMVIHDADTVKPRVTLDNWNEFDGPLTTLKIGVGFLLEYAGFLQDEAGKQQMDSADADLEPAFEVRDFRIMMSGRFKTKRFITWKAGLMFDGESSSWFVRETGVMIGVPEISGYIFVGRTKEGFSLNKVMVGYANWAMERQMAIDVIPILADGIKWLGYLPRQRLFWNIGVFVNWLSKNQSFSTYEWQFAVRAGWLPVYSKDRKTLLHLGASYRYGVPEEGEIQVRSRPEANPAPFFINTGKFAAQHSNHVGGEIYFTHGPLMLGSEYYIHKFTSPETDHPAFQGGEIVASYIITGESRPYSTVSGIFGFVPVNKSVFKGGPGAWEVLLRFSAYDLNSGTLQGGRFWRITPMINWYLSDIVRFELAYGFGKLDRYGLTGSTHFFQSRIQILF